jgi:flagellar assembly protein FliH
MLSKIIEHSASGSPAEAFLLERVSDIPQQYLQPTEQKPAPDSPDVQALTRRITQLEQALAETEIAAYNRGRREAEAEAHQRFGAAMQSTSERLAQAVKQLADVRPRLCKEAESDLLRLAMAIAQRILHRQLTVDPTALEALVKVSLDRLGRLEQVRVRVSASLADSVRAILAKLSSRSVETVPDANLEAGSLIFETNRGQLDASIHSQLAEIESGLIDCLANRPEGRN